MIVRDTSSGRYVINLSLVPILVVLLEIVITLSHSAYLPVMPQFAADMLISDDQARDTLLLYTLGSASLYLFVGPFSDRFGRRLILIWGGVCFVVASAICAITSNISLFYVMRFVQGISVCTTMTAGYASIHELLERKIVIQVLAWMYAVGVLVPALGPLLGAIILLFGTWRLLFWIFFVVGIIVVFALYRLMPESLPVEKRHQIKLLPILKNYYLIIKNPLFSLNTLIYSILNCGLFAWVAVGPFLIIEEFKENDFLFGIYQVLIFGLFIIGTMAIRYAMKFFSTRIISFVGVVIAFISAVLAVVFAIIFPKSLLALIVCLMFFAGGSGFSFPSINRTAIESSTGPAGATVATFFTGSALFGALGTFLPNIIYDGSIFSLAVIIGLCGIVAMLLKLILLLKYTRIQIWGRNQV